VDDFLLHAPVPFDYQWLQDQLQSYSSPRSKIGSLMRSGQIIRVKKGLYLPGAAAKRLYSKETLANLIYGPSYISCEYALAWHGFIPERTETVTSVTGKRHKIFMTPVGNFSYDHVRQEGFFIDVWLFHAEAGQSPFFMAGPTKALIDLLLRQKKLHSPEDVAEFLTVDLRIDRPDLLRFDLKALQAIQLVLQAPQLAFLRDCLRQLKRKESA
jgi:hypothetical protein